MKAHWPSPIPWELDPLLAQNSDEEPCLDWAGSWDSMLCRPVLKNMVIFEGPPSVQNIGVSTSSPRSSSQGSPSPLTSVEGHAGFELLSCFVWMQGICLFSSVPI